jgi:hypothetical protein
MHESMVYEYRGSHPPRQPLPIPTPSQHVRIVCTYHRRRILTVRPRVSGWEVREQQGKLSGHFVVASQDGGDESAATRAVSVDTASKTDRIHRAIIPERRKFLLLLKGKVGCEKGGKK